MNRCAAISCLIVLAAPPATAQQPTRIRMLRCVSPGESICTELLLPADSGSVIPGRFGRTTLQGVSNPSRSPGAPRVFAIGVATLSQLARLPSAGWVATREASDSSDQRVVWSPPLIAMPTFQGSIDRTAIRGDMGEALGIGTVGGGNRPAIAAIAALIILAFWTVVPRWWGGELIASTLPDDSPARGGASAGPAAPRSPEDITKQTARRTALRR